MSLIVFLQLHTRCVAENVDLDMKAVMNADEGIVLAAEEGFCCLQVYSSVSVFILILSCLKNCSD